MWQQTYRDVWSWYYTDEHVQRLMRRNAAYGIKPMRILRGVLQIYGAPHFEGVHPQQCGYLRRKDRLQRRPEMPREALVPHTLRFLVETAAKYGQFGLYGLKLIRMRNAVRKEAAYTDFAVTPVVEAEGEALEMFSLNDASRAAVEKAKRQAGRAKRTEELADAS